MEDWCMYCSSWYTGRILMTKYIEGIGRCVETGDITFCMHNCIFCDHKCDSNEEDE